MVLVTGSGLPDQQNIRGRMDDSEWNSHRKVGGKICHWQGCIQVLKKVVLDIIIVKCCTFLIDVLGYFCLTYMYDTISNYSAIIGRNMSLFKVHLFKFIYAMPAVSQVYMYRYICVIWCLYMYRYMFICIKRVSVHRPSCTVHIRTLNFYLFMLSLTVLCIKVNFVLIFLQFFHYRSPL